MARLFGCPINVEEDGGGGSSIAVEVSLSGNQPDDGEATSFSAGLPRTIPYYRFLESNSDSMESESDHLHHCFIDFFDRESYIASNQRLSNSYDDLDMEEEEELELGFNIGSGSGSGSDHSGGLGLRATEIDSFHFEIETGRVEADSGRVEVETGRVEADSGRVEVETGWVGIETGRVGIETGRVGIETGRAEVETGRVEVETGRVEVNTGRVEVVSDLPLVEVEAQNPITWGSEPVEEANLLSEEIGSLPMDYTYNNQEDDEQEEQEWHASLFDAFFEDSFDNIFGLLTSIDEYAENHEAVLARTFDDDESGVNGSPPASKRFVDELPDVEIITSEELSIGCAICKDEIVVEEEGKVKRLPCKHYYHGECIVPWLGIRNTCPVCRYELPTDDLEYERNRRAQRVLATDLMSE